MIKHVIYLLLLFLPVVVLGQTIEVTQLRTGYKVNPMGIERAPRLSWQIVSTERNVLQTAYRILVADDPELLQNDKGNIWDSKKVSSPASIQVLYSGKALQPTQTYYWKVMVWDNQNNASPWSKKAAWQMGLPTAADWKDAQWIAYGKMPDSMVNILPTDGKKDTYQGSDILPLLRKNFSVSKPVKKATLFISGLGHFELSINGKKTGDHFLDPGWTKYDKQALYVPFDITEQLNKGTNTIGVMLGNGFYYIPSIKGRYRKLKVAFGYPKMICRLAIEYADGATENIISDTSWKTAPGPITFSSIYGGEDYNANLEQKGWDTPLFNDSKWRHVILVDGPPQLNVQLPEPVKIFEHFSPKKITQPQPDIRVYDLAQNASGIVRIQVKGNKGDTVKIIPGELLKEDGTVTQKASGGPYYFQYILKGDSIETWQPRFTYYGFRYVQAEVKAKDSANQPPKIVALTGLHIRNAAERVGQFTCSNDLFNRTNTLIDWAIKSNMVSVFTDCPHREKLGWLEEAHLMGPSVRYNYAIANLCCKEINDMKFSQTPEGLIPEIAPEYVKFEWGGGMFRDSPEWGSSSILLPWYVYQWYGDKQLLEETYPMMQRYIAYLRTKANDHILTQGLGDWYDIGPKPPGVSQLTPMGVTATAIYYYDLTVLNKVAQLLNRPQDASDYQRLAAEVKKAFNKTFFNKETKQYATGSQTANAMAVYMNLVEPEYRQAVVENIVKDIRSRNNSLTAGDIGYRYLLRVLEKEGRSDVIFDMNSRSDVPGYGYQLAKGATALTESWQAYPTVSNNHFMLGHLMEWFYSGLGGIRPAEDAVAFHKIAIRPEPVGDVTAAQTNYQSPYGVIATKWEKGSGRFELEVQIPANTTATVYLPVSEKAAITESNQRVANRKDMQWLGYKNGKAMIRMGSGNYRLVAIDGEIVKQTAESK